ncbi:MAG: hypothetical protein IJ391_06455 [Clostridia bacterium]|nr:hypothetical protein [Clostridia bacterium]
MKCTYKIRTDNILDEDNNTHTVYGIEVWQDNILLKAVPDVFVDHDRAKTLVMLCNNEKLDPIHLMDVIEDELN